jgi:hypothetical protein
MRQSPLVGYNNNVRHRGQLFHIQTEDSGVSHPHVITHLFMDGGRILKSVKTSYAEHAGVERVSDYVRTLMKDQHKAMLLRLRAGEFDVVIGPIPHAAIGQSHEADGPASRITAETHIGAKRAAELAHAKPAQPIAFGELPPLPVPAGSAGSAGSFAAPTSGASASQRGAMPGRSEGRYGATEPALPFGDEHVMIPKNPIRSLDDIILGYIAEDLE